MSTHTLWYFFLKSSGSFQGDASGVELDDGAFDLALHLDQGSGQRGASLGRQERHQQEDRLALPDCTARRWYAPVGGSQPASQRDGDEKSAASRHLDIAAIGPLPWHVRRRAQPLLIPPRPRAG